MAKKRTTAKPPKIEEPADILVSLPELPKVPDRVLRDVVKAGRGNTIKIRSKADYDAVIARFGDPNPMGWNIIHEPELGHHTMVYANRCEQC